MALPFRLSKKTKKKKKKAEATMIGGWHETSPISSSTSTALEK